MRKYDLYGGLRDAELSIEKLNALARETASRAVREGKSAFYRANARAAKDDRRAIEDANAALEAANGSGTELPVGADEFADSFYIIEKAAGEAENYARELGALPLEAEGDRIGCPRLYSIAVEMVSKCDGRITGETMEGYLAAYQAVRPLKMREVRALIGMLNLALVRQLRLDADSICIRAEQYAAAEAAAEKLCAMPKGSRRRDAITAKLELEQNPAAAERLMTILRERDEYALCERIEERLSLGGSAAARLLSRDRNVALACARRIGNAIASLKYLQGIDRGAFFGRYSEPESILRQDTTYRAMDEASRGYYAQQLERIAARCGAGETVAARMAARLAGEGTGKAAHIGYYLIEREGISRLCSALRPDRRFDYADEDTRLALALCGEGVIMLALIALCGMAGWVAAMVGIIPAWCIAREIMVRFALKLCPPRRIPRLSLEEGISDHAATIVSVPVLITGEGDVTAALRRLETHYLANPYKNCCFAVLGDFKDSDAEHMDGEDGIIALAKKQTAELNAQYAKDGETIFYFLHRRRTYSAASGKYMGHERKRGAIMELCSLIINGDDEPFALITSPLPANIKYCLTLDADTVLPKGELKRLVGAMEHPLNAPEQDGAGIVRAGYGVIVPRMRQTLSGAARSRFAALISRSAGVDIYSSLAGEYYQDVYGTGLFGGKGIFNISCFYSALFGKLPDNAILSHDLIEGCYLRAGFAHDITLFDEEPAAFLPWWKRQHRWIRGDWQLLPFAMRKTRDASGAAYCNPIGALGRAKLLGNMLNSLVPIAALVCFMLMPYTNGGLYAALALIALCRGAVWELIGLIRRFVTARIDELDVRGAIEEAKPALLNGLMQLSTLPYAAVRTADAIARTLWRVYASHKNMLQWQTAAQGGGNMGELGKYYAAMWPCAAFAALFLAGAFIGARLACMLLLALFASAGVLIMYLDAPLTHKELSAENRQYILAAARDTWGFFETFCAEKNGFLPPDNFQHRPLGRAVNNTSPTNIGMAITSAIAAQELGFIDENRLYEMLLGICRAIEGLEKWHGHLYNWYSVETMRPLHPKYVSAVDSGNLAAALMCAEVKLASLGRKETAARFGALYTDIDFGLLADGERKLLSIGFDAEAGRLSKSRYDLFASEARLTYFVAAALNKIDARYYYSLSRLLTSVRTRRVHLSWSGTMFEYLMPIIFTGSVYMSAAGESAENAVYVQQLCARRGMPWGVSESGYYAFDANMLYQYRAFGERRLALCPYREEESVAAPYASMLALMTDPNEAAANLRRLEAIGARGKYGFYEAVDFTARRLPDNCDMKTVESYMAHHQGMALCAAANALKDNCISRLFLANAYARAANTLLEERRSSHAVAIRRYLPRREREIKPCAARPPRVSHGQYRVSEAKLLSNGSYTVFVCDNGTGYSARRGRDITKYTPDGIRCTDGTFIAVNAGNAAFTLTDAPANGEGTCRCTLDDFRVVHEKELHGVKLRAETYVDPARDAEIRLISLTNTTDGELRADVGTFTEMALSDREEYAAHPAFVRLSIDAALHAGGVLFTRRSVKGAALWAYAALIDADTLKSDAVYTTDALIMPGRGRSIIDAMGQLSITQGDVSAPIEPMLCARAVRTIPPQGTARLAFVMGAEDTEHAAKEAMQAAIDGTRDIEYRAWAAEKRERSLSRVSAGKAELFERIAARAIMHIPHKSADMAGIKTGADILYKFGIDPNVPIISMRVRSISELRKLKTLLEFMRYASARGVKAQLAVIGGYPMEYQNDLRSRIESLMHAMHMEGIRLIHGFELGEGEAERIEALSLIVIEPRTSLNRQFAPENARIYETAAKEYAAEDSTAGDIEYGFDADGSFRFTLAPGQVTPLPWANIMANERFGTMVTERGGGYTWCGNSSQAKLTPWYNDPVRDPMGSFMLIMNKHSGRVCQIEAGPLAHTARTVRCGFGYSLYTGEEGGIRMAECVFTDDTAAVRYALITLENAGDTAAEMRLFFGAELTLGEREHRHAIHTRRTKQGILARSLMNGEQAYMACIGADCEYGDEREALLNGAWMAEETLRIIGTAQGFAALRADISIPKGEVRRLCICLGGGNEEAMAAICSQSIGDIEHKLDCIKAAWRDKLGVIKIKTPDARLDTLMNGRLCYQTLVSRVLGKTGYYQCSGATGFRDQLQDMLALMYAEPERARRHIIECAAHQFKEGDVMHWWHEGDTGVRTHISDDRLFLPYVAAEYARITGDKAIWHEQAEYVSGPELSEAERDIYRRMERTEDEESVFMHCVRAIDSSLAVGAHGLPLMGGGDWNDGMDSVGRGGGESVWLGMFLYDVLMRFVPLCADMGEGERAAIYKEHAEGLKKAVQANAWDGAWYKRAYFAGGQTLGGAENECCRIDLICQAWAGITGMANAETAFVSAMNALVDTRHATAALLAPAFDRADESIGYITAYVPGVRENGGQYTHAAAWMIRAACALGRANDAHALIRLLNPIERTASREGMLSYMGEPYAVAGDVYTTARQKGRAGWTWYTGAAAWIYKCVLEDVLGFKKSGDTLKIEPCTEFEEYEIEYRYGGAKYYITVKKGERQGYADGIRLADDGKEHTIVLYRE